MSLQQIPNAYSLLVCQSKAMLLLDAIDIDFVPLGVGRASGRFAGNHLARLLGQRKQLADVLNGRVVLIAQLFAQLFHQICVLLLGFIPLGLATVRDQG